MDTTRELNLVVLDGYAVNPGDASWDSFKEIGKVTVYDRTKPEQVAERAHDADILINCKVRIGAAQLDSMPKVRCKCAKRTLFV